jgi:hypothetical protein
MFAGLQSELVWYSLHPDRWYLASYWQPVWNEGMGGPRVGECRFDTILKPWGDKHTEVLGEVGETLGKKCVQSLVSECGSTLIPKLIRMGPRRIVLNDPPKSVFERGVVIREITRKCREDLLSLISLRKNAK